MTEPTVVVQKAYDWALWTIPKVEKFPKSYRFSIGQTLVASSIEPLMNLVDATYQTRNTGSLAAAVREVNCIRYLMRLAKDLRVINLAAHEFAEERPWPNRVPAGGLLVRHVNDDVASRSSAIHGGHNVRQYRLHAPPPVSTQYHYGDLAIPYNRPLPRRTGVCERPA